MWFSDERMVPPDHPDSNFAMASTALLSRLSRPPTVVRIRGELGAEAAAGAYEALLRERIGSDPRFDLILLGHRARRPRRLAVPRQARARGARALRRAGAARGDGAAGAARDAHLPGPQRRARGRLPRRRRRQGRRGRARVRRAARPRGARLARAARPPGRCSSSSTRPRRRSCSGRPVHRPRRRGHEDRLGDARGRQARRPSELVKTDVSDSDALVGPARRADRAPAHRRRPSRSASGCRRSSSSRPAASPTASTSRSRTCRCASC